MGSHERRVARWQYLFQKQKALCTYAKGFLMASYILCLAAGFTSAAGRLHSAHAPYFVTSIVGYEQGAVGHSYYAYGAAVGFIRVATD